MGQTGNCEQETYGSAERSKKAGSTPSDVPIEILMISTYCREKYFSDNRDKDPETFVPSTKEFNKNLLSIALFLIESKA